MLRKLIAVVSGTDITFATRSGRASPSGLLGFAALTIACLTFNGCVVHADLVAPVRSFQASYAAAAPALMAYYTERNQFERRLYLDDILHSPDAPLAFSQNQEHTAYFLPPDRAVFSQEAVQARVNAIRLLGAYADKLVALASSDTPEQVASATQTLGTDLQNLGQKFQQLANSPGDSSALAYVAPITAIVALVAERIVSSRREAMLARAIEIASGPVDTILRQLEVDLRDRIVLAANTGLLQQIATTVRYYNNIVRSYNEREAERQTARPDPPVSNVASTASPPQATPGSRRVRAASRADAPASLAPTAERPVESVPPRPVSPALPSPEEFRERREVLADTSNLIHEFELLQQADPIELVRAMRDAQEALVQFARHPTHRPQDLSELQQVVENFAARATQIVDAVQQIRTFRNGGSL